MSGHLGFSMPQYALHTVCRTIYKHWPCPLSHPYCCAPRMHSLLLLTAPLPGVAQNLHKTGAESLQLHPLQAQSG